MKPWEVLKMETERLEAPGVPLVEVQVDEFPQEKQSCFECQHYVVCSVVQDFEDVAAEHMEIQLDIPIYLASRCPYFTKLNKDG